MNTYEQFNVETGKLSMFSRLSRLLLGVLLLAIPMGHSGMLHSLAVLPLLAIYPILTSVLGCSLVKVLFANSRPLAQPPRRVKFARGSLLALGIGLIGSVLLSPTAPVWLALLGIFPVLMGALDSDLLGKAVMPAHARQTQDRKQATPLQAQQPSKPMHPAVTEELHTKQAA